jgi:ElaB/YqjD/DUF883 family membrane-anchored ribosome-binding protein
MYDRDTPVSDQINSLVENQLNALRRDLTNLRHDLGEFVRSAMDVGRSGAGQATERLQGQLQDRLDQFQHTFDDMRKRGRRTYSTVQQGVSHYPMTSLLIAVGVGVLAGAILRRS